MLALRDVQLLLAFCVYVQANPHPIAQEWSSTSYGPDGPWNAVVISTSGNTTSRQSIDLSVGTYWQTYLLSDHYCDDFPGPSSCPANASSLIKTPLEGLNKVPDFHPEAAWPLGQAGSAQQTDVYSFNMQVSSDLNDLVVNASVAIVNSSWLTLPDGTNYPHTLGTLSFGSPYFDLRLGGEYTLVTTPVSDLFKRNHTASSSIGVHIGSVHPKILGSMYYGGYDRTRVLGNVFTSGSADDLSTSLALDLLDIGIDSVAGNSPFGFSTASGLLAHGNSSISGSIEVQISPNSPYLYLPRSTCDAITSNLPVVYQQKYGLYFWNTSDPTYNRIVSSASFLTFKLGQKSPITIKVPWTLLNLTLEEPIISFPTAYFPCRPYDHSSYILGQAFLQAAFFALDWQVEGGSARLFIAQAPGPGAVGTPDIVTIVNGTQNLSASKAVWEDTWKDHWNQLPNPSSDNDSSSAASSSTGLSSGAKAGIGVGVTVAVLAVLGVAGFFLWKRQRSTKTGPISIIPKKKQVFEKSVTSPRGQLADTSRPAEAPTRPNEVFELHAERPVPELQ